MTPSFPPRRSSYLLLPRLSRIAELPQEPPEEVLGREGCDRRLDAVTGDVADHRGDAGGGHPEHVVEVAGHEPGSGLVGAAQLEAGEVGQLLGCAACGPLAWRQLLLREHLLGPPLAAGSVLGTAGPPAQASPNISRPAH